MASVSKLNNKAAPLTTHKPRQGASPNPRLQSDSQRKKNAIQLQSASLTHTRFIKKKKKKKRLKYIQVDAQLQQLIRSFKVIQDVTPSIPIQEIDGNVDVMVEFRAERQRFISRS